MKKSTYISPTSRPIELEPAHMLAGSIRMTADTEQGIDNANQIRANKFEWNSGDEFWEDK